LTIRFRIYRTGPGAWMTPGQTPAPSTPARAAHTAVWTGSEMIVWGGSDGSNTLNTGGRYNPATDSWTATSITNQTPHARAAHTAVWTGSEMIIWGAGLIPLSSCIPEADTIPALTLGRLHPRGPTPDGFTRQYGRVAK